MARFTLTFGRKARVADYETVHIELSQEYDDQEITWDKAIHDVRQFVLKRIEVECAARIEKEIGAAPAKSEFKQAPTPPTIRSESQQAPAPKTSEPATPQPPARALAQQKAPVGEVEIDSIDWQSGPNGDWIYRQNTRGVTDPFIVTLRDYLDSEIARGAKGPVRIGPWLVGYNDSQHVFIGRRVA